LIHRWPRRLHSWSPPAVAMRRWRPHPTRRRGGGQGKRLRLPHRHYEPNDGVGQGEVDKGQDEYPAVHQLARRLLAYQALRRRPLSLLHLLPGLRRRQGDLNDLHGLELAAGDLEDLDGAGKDIDFEGAANTDNFDPNGDVLQSLIEISQIAGGEIVDAVHTFKVDLGTAPPTITKVTEYVSPVWQPALRGDP